MGTLAVLEVLAGNGVLFVEDPSTGFGGEPPDMGDGPVVVSSPGHLVLVVRHAVEGLTSVRVVTESADVSLPVAYYEGEFTSAHGELAVRDVGNWNRITVHVGAISFRLRIFADALDEPSRLEIVVPGL